MHLFRQAFEHLLKTDLVFCETHDVEFHIWKICFYHIVEALKLCAKEQPDVKRNMLQLLDEGLDFYAQMLDTLDQVFFCPLDRIDCSIAYSLLDITSPASSVGRAWDS